MVPNGATLYDLKSQDTLIMRTLLVGTKIHYTQSSSFEIKIKSYNLSSGHSNNCIGHSILQLLYQLMVVMVTHSVEKCLYSFLLVLNISNNLVSTN